jgi:hypothetical protein
VLKQGTYASLQSMTSVVLERTARNSGASTVRPEDIDSLRWTLRVVPFAPGSPARPLRRHRQYQLGPDGLLSVTRLGTPSRTDYYGAQLFKKAVGRAKLPDSVTPHDLCHHHFASELLDAGASSGARPQAVLRR